MKLARLLLGFGSSEKNYTHFEWKENTFFELVTTYLTDKSIILRLENWYVENPWICLKTWENQCHDLKFRCATHFVFTFPNQNKGSETLTTAPTRRITVLHWYSHIRYFGKVAELKLPVFVDSFLESSFLVGRKLFEKSWRGNSQSLASFFLSS